MQLPSNRPTNYLVQIAKGPTWLFDLLVLPIVRLIVSRCFVCHAVISGPVVFPCSSRNDSVGRGFCFSSVLPLAALLSVALPSSLRVLSFQITFVKHSHKQIVLNAVLACTCESHRLLNSIYLVSTVSVCLQSWSYSRLAPELSLVLLLIVLNKQEYRDVIQ